MTHLSLTICVPIYNWDVTVLVRQLREQRQELSIACALLLVDDASTKRFDTLELDEGDRFIQLDVNAGRSAIRNFMVKEVETTHVLFLDADCLLSDGFLKKYEMALQKNEDAVLCGGLEYPDEWNEEGSLLRYNYGVSYESVNLDNRKLSPYDSFKTSNFMAPKVLMLAMTFNESLTQYGHEDTLFGLELKEQGEQIIHIDAPVIHLGLESNEVFLNKTVLALENLLNLSQEYPDIFKGMKILRLTSGILNNPISRLWARKNIESYKEQAIVSSDVKAFQKFKLAFILLNRNG